MRERYNNNGCSPLCLHLHDKKQQSAVRTKIPDIWRTTSLFAYPGSCKLCASCSRNTYMAACLRNGGWVMGSYWLIKSWNWWKFTVQVFLLKSKAFNTLQSSKIATSDRFSQCNCCLGGLKDSWCFPPLCHSRILPSLLFLNWQFLLLGAWEKQ